MVYPNSSVLPAPKSNAINLTALDGRIREMDIALADLKRRRNAMLTINRLPAELLLAVFLCHRDHLRKDSLQQSSELWLAYSHVSHHWRTLALSTPLLWNFADLRYEVLATNMLNRAGNLPIYICLSEQEDITSAEDTFYSTSPRGVVPSRPFEYPSDSFVALLESRPCCAIDVCGGSEELDKALILACTNSTSEITSMDIVYQASEPAITGMAEDVPQVYTITDSASSRMFPKLAHAGFRNCVIDWELPLFSTSAALRRLDISAYHKYVLPGDTQHLIASNIVRALTNFPLLEDFSISKSIAILDDVPTAIAPTTELLMLPHLRALRVHDGAAHVFSLLRRLRVHSSCGLDIESLPYYERPANWTYRMAIVDWIFKSRDGPLPSVERLMVSCGMYSYEIGVEQLPSQFGENQPYWNWNAMANVVIAKEEMAYVLAAISAFTPKILRVLSVGDVDVDRLALHALGRMSTRKITFVGTYYVSTFPDMLVKSAGFLEQLEEVELEYAYTNPTDIWDEVTAAFVHRVAGGIFRVVRLKIHRVTAASQELANRWAGLVPEVYLNGHRHY